MTALKLAQCCYIYLFVSTVSNVKDIRDFPVYKFAVHDTDVTGVLFECYNISRTGKDMEKLSVSNSTISRLLLNKTINRITNISFHKRFKGAFHHS